MYVETIGGQSIILVSRLTAGIAEQVAADLGRTLGGVPTSGGRPE